MQGEERAAPRKEGIALPIRWLVTDFDGTLLDEHGAITAETLRALHDAQRGGIPLIAASGRMALSMLPYVRELASPLPFIACNGAEIRDPATLAMLRTQYLPTALALEIAQVLEAEGCYYQVYQGDGYYYAAQTPESQAYQASSGVAGEAVGRLSAFIRQPLPKMLIIAPPAQVPLLAERVRARFGAQLTVTVSDARYVEITHCGASKGAALRWLCGHLGLVLAEGMAFGDAENDASMLAAAGVSVAMGNAQPSLKAQAAHVCGTNAQDGIARFLRRTVLRDAAWAG